MSIKPVRGNETKAPRPYLTPKNRQCARRENLVFFRPAMQETATTPQSGSFQSYSGVEHFLCKAYPLSASEHEHPINCLTSYKNLKP
ncbi:hypothetical protein CEXT_721571 [Caerostris extrusa]|uniref:Uncharacterized protein n=1 Tax=Caerostris extrusa TaxID=172846 RepID=A0AAV4M3G2_CAEEX|nr:hypothetical protein CEXT_721571 [Caerostris extrusa]